MWCINKALPKYIHVLLEFYGGPGDYLDCRKTQVTKCIDGGLDSGNLNTSPIYTPSKVQSIFVLKNHIALTTPYIHKIISSHFQLLVVVSSPYIQGTNQLPSVA
jgi:hypothetical protein